MCYCGCANSYKYKYNGKEWQDELGLNFYDFGFRNYDPAIGRWFNTDPLAEKRYELSLYNYVQNSPLFRFDPNGLTDYTLNRETGEVKEVGKPNNEKDRILKTDSKGNVKKKGEGFLGFLVPESERGKEKVAIGGIEKGILKDGQNFKEKGELFEIGGKGNPTREGVEKFALQLSEYVGKEVEGLYVSNDASKEVTHMTIGGYEENEIDETNNLGVSALRKVFTITEITEKIKFRGHYHTHPGGSTNASEADIKIKGSYIDKYSSKLFNIITYPMDYNNGYPQIISY